MSWTRIKRELEKFIDSEEFQKLCFRETSGDPKRGLAIALRELYNERNPWGHRI